MATIEYLGFFRTRLGFKLINNDGKDLTITGYYMTFPADNGTLYEVVFPPYTSWQGEKSSSADITLTSNQVIKDGEEVIFYHMFGNVAKPTEYYLKITFDDASFAEFCLSTYKSLYYKRIQEFSDNLVAHWDLDDRTGIVAVDSTGRNDGAITGTTLGQPGIGDSLKSMGFDGTNDFIDISAIASDLMLNGGFETAGGGGADIWANWIETAGDGALANEGATIHTGAGACKMTAGAGLDTKVATPVITVVPGTCRLRFWTQGDGTHDGRYSVWNSTTSSSIIGTTATGVTGAAYAKVDVDFTVPVGTTQIQISLKCPGTDGGVCYFDTVSLRRTDVPTFDPHEGSLIVWAKVDGAGVWSDNADRNIALIRADAQNRLILRKTAANSLSLSYEANNVADFYVQASTEILWFPIGMTWSLSGDALQYYYKTDNVASDSGLGVWTGNLSSIQTLVGAENQDPAFVFHGNLAHGQLYNTAWDADTMKYLMSLP